MNYEVVKIDFNGNTKDNREEAVNTFLKEGWRVSSLTGFSGNKSYGIVKDAVSHKQRFTTVNFNHNNVPSRQLSPIKDIMKDGWKVVSLTGFSSDDGKEYGVAAVLERLEQCEQENSDS